MPISSNNQNLYGFTNPLSLGAPIPQVANRAPTGSDHAPYGTLWIWPATAQVWVSAAQAQGTTTWNLLEASGGLGLFTTLTSTETTTLATGGVNANTFGNTNGATSLALEVGTGGFTLNGVGSSAYTIGAATTTGAISIGGTAQTGAINIGTGTGAQTINLGTGGSGVKTINVGTGAVANIITVGSALTGSVTLTAVNGNVAITPSIASGTGASQTLNARVGVVTYTGFTTASSAKQVFTIVNSNILATSFVTVSVANLNASTNGALMGIQGVTQAAGSIAIATINNGAGALGSGDNVLISFVVNS